MAIGYARAEFVQRSNGKSACAKAAYNARSRIEFEGNCLMPPAIYDWSFQKKPAFHEILLPAGVHEKYKVSQTLWNAAESVECRVNSVVGLEVLLALPDDQAISLEDKIDLCKTFIQEQFVDKGLAAQIDIHYPEKKIVITRDHREAGLFKGMTANVISEQKSLLELRLEDGKTASFSPEEFTGFSYEESNWHAHVLITTRRFQKEGVYLGEKARDLMPRIAKGKVVSGPDWGKLWTHHQNSFFEKKGIDLRVDPPGIEPQEHLGPYRMRGRAFALLQEHGRILEENKVRSLNVASVLDKITERQSVFTKDDVDRFAQKHVPLEFRRDFDKEFWTQGGLVPLVDKETGEVSGKYSSVQVIEEERRILRLSDALFSKKSLKVNLENVLKFSTALNDEQSKAFKEILSGNRLACIHGYAGTGKSHLLAALKNAYLESGYRVRGFGPDSATADVLIEKGFDKAENIYRFLFGLRNSKRDVSSGKEVWMLDEAGKLGNKPLQEFLRESSKRNIQVILAGDYAQLNSVGRGGLFKVFCERYSPHVLKEIQRQNSEKQRDLAKNLAFGEIGAALDKLSSGSALRWSNSKKEAMEQLIAAWAEDTRFFPLASTLIIAHSNAEVRVLNELVRNIRKLRGELEDRELCCETSFGSVYLSVGDVIEFRKNEKTLGVTNGMTGVLVEAEPGKFVVSVGEKNVRTVVFNPKEYHSYQLGYASTYFRSQGETVSRAYVLHSAALNKKMFYVGLTRHVDQAYYFVSKDQAYCLADLKRQAIREDVKENTLKFLTPQDIQKRKDQEKNQTEIQALKESDSFLERMKGYGLFAIERVRAKVSLAGEKFVDRLPCQEFYQVKASPGNIAALVQEVKPERGQLEEVPLLGTIIREKKPEVSQVSPSKDKPGLNLSTPEEFFNILQNKKPALWNSISSENQKVLKKYFAFSEAAYTSRSVVDLYQLGHSERIEQTNYYKTWQRACGDRNQAAFDVKLAWQEQEIFQFLGKRMAGILLEQASRHEKVLEKKDTFKQFDVEDGLKEHIEPLLYRLFPEGPTRRDRNSLRFGAKGSLSVVCCGEKVGQFYDFERQEGGSLLKLIQRELGLGFAESREWAKQFLGCAHEIQMPKVFQKSSLPSQEREWVSVLPKDEVPAPRLEEVSNKKLQYYFEEMCRHAYRDEKGGLLYYVLRLRDRQDASRKITPPLSYGYWKSHPGHLLWELKGFSSEKNVLYRVPELKQNPHATVLVVEGEKTADRALEKFPGGQLVCVTWPGGAGAVRFADWRPLAGRRVIVWPDNDQAGLKAGESVCSELRRVGVSSLQIVDFNELSQRFPQKWDLADDLPEGVSLDILSSLLKTALHKGVDPRQVAYRAFSGWDRDLFDLIKVNEILWRVDERLRKELEAQFGSGSVKVNERIIEESSRIILGIENKEKGEKAVKIDLELKHHMRWLTGVHEAEYGKEPSHWALEKMRNMIGAVSLGRKKEDSDITVDLCLARLYDKASSFGGKIAEEKIQKELAESRLIVAKSFDANCEPKREFCRNLEMQK